MSEMPPPLPWRALPWSAASADAQLASIDALLTEITVPLLRWHLMVPPALVLGASQKLTDVNSAACQQRGVPVFRRRAGGSAVLTADSLLNLDIALPAGHPLYSDDIGRSGEWLGRVLAEGLRELGVDAYPASRATGQIDRPEAEHPALARMCYGGIGVHEIVVDIVGADLVKRPAKVIGIAQFRRKVGCVFMCGVLMSWHPEDLAVLVAADDQVAAATVALAPRARGLDSLLRHPIGTSQVCAAIEHALVAVSHAIIIPAGWTAAQMAAREQARAACGALTDSSYPPQ